MARTKVIYLNEMVSTKNSKKRMQKKKTSAIIRRENEEAKRGIKKWDSTIQGRGTEKQRDMERDVSDIRWRVATRAWYLRLLSWCRNE